MVMVLNDDSYITHYVKGMPVTDGAIIGGLELLKADIISDCRGFDEEIRDW